MAKILPSVLAEHQAPLRTDKPVGYNPTEEEQAAIKLAEKLYSEAKRYRQIVDWKWIDFYKFFRGKQWKERRPRYRHSEVYNIIFSEIQTIVALLTDTRPKIEALPEDPSDYQFAEIISNLLSYNWDHYNFSSTVAEAVTDASVFGTAIGYVPWNSELCDGLGDYEFKTIDPFFFYPDPNAEGRINDPQCGYVIMAKPEDVDKVRRQYPENAESITADLSDMETDFARDDQNQDILIRSPVDNRVLLQDGSRNTSNKPNQVLVITLYLRSEEVVEQQIGEQLDPQTGLKTPLFQTKKKYPNGRCIKVANGVLLKDGDNPYKKFPYARLVDYTLPREFWGSGEVEQLSSMQTTVNTAISYLLDILKLTANPIWVVDAEAGVDEDNLTNQPGLAVVKNKGGEVRRESGTNAPPFIFDIVNLMMDRIGQKLSSTTEVSTGAVPSANSSGYAIEQLQEAAQTKIRPKARNLEVFLKDIGDLMFDRIMDNYTLPRVVRITNDQKAAAQYFKIQIEKVPMQDGEYKNVATVQPYSFDQGTNSYQEQPPQTYELKSKMDLRFSVGTTLPFAKAQKAAMADKLFDKGIIDPEEYLTQLDYPNKEKILQGLAERQQQMAQQQAQGQLPPQGGQPNG